MTWTASVQCENALHSVSLILADARRHAASLDPVSSRRDVGRSHALALGAMVSVCEDYCQAVLSELVESGIGTNETGRLLWDDVATRIFVSWNAHLGLWAKWGVDVFKASEYQRFEGLIEARNAAIHGLGVLTRVQRRKAGATARITAGGLTVSGNHIIIDDAALMMCRGRSIDLMKFLDREFQSLDVAP